MHSAAWNSKVEPKGIVDRERSLNLEGTFFERASWSPKFEKLNKLNIESQDLRAFGGSYPLLARNTIFQFGLLKALRQQRAIESKLMR